MSVVLDLRGRMLSLEDKKSFEEQWEALQLKELKFYSQKSGFIHDVVTKMAEAFQQDHYIYSKIGSCEYFL
ncbi:hypothetical protein Bca4012_018665 [Brassica carinata]